MPYGKYKRPNPKMLGTGTASEAGRAIQKRQRTKRDRMSSIMRDIENTRGTQNFKNKKH